MWVTEGECDLTQCYTSKNNFDLNHSVIVKYEVKESKKKEKMVIEIEKMW